MWSIETDDLVAWYVSLSVTRLRCAKTAKRIEVLFVAKTRRNPRHFVKKLLSVSYYSEGVRCGLGQITLATCTMTMANSYKIFALCRHQTVQ